MSNNHKSRTKEARLRIQAVQTILKRWDPMDLAPGEFAPADEYDSYAPHIVSLVFQGYSAEQILEHLQRLRSGMVCMRENPRHDIEIAGEIIATLRNTLEGNDQQT
ncbi:hypothetical protein [Acaryochloris marina]|uniref:hypothetical protein n=1 Tax=Acaryochloris marina TaxID=155978 RepID=UPI001BB0688B|nr:hypothetical protein [Acaryochloris marina]QUY41427.1 hypothetical protein I1H34_19485 [Acaryochloris marina S15]